MMQTIYLTRDKESIVDSKDYDNSKEIEISVSGQLAVVEETLSDGSVAYGVRVLSVYIPCRSMTCAMDMFNSKNKCNVTPRLRRRK